MSDDDDLLMDDDMLARSGCAKGVLSALAIYAFIGGIAWLIWWANKYGGL